MRSSRKRVKRRDRRKAKQTGYRREGKKMGARVGHGASGSPGGPRQLSKVSTRKPLLIEIAPEREGVKEKHSAKATIREILFAKGQIDAEDDG